MNNWEKNGDTPHGRIFELRKFLNDKFKDEKIEIPIRDATQPDQNYIISRKLDGKVFYIINNLIEWTFHWEAYNNDYEDWFEKRESEINAMFKENPILSNLNAITRKPNKSHKLWIEPISPDNHQEVIFEIIKLTASIMGYSK